MEKMTKKEKCKFCFPDLVKNENIVKTIFWCNTKGCEVRDDDCENCNNFKSRYIEYPIEVSAIDTKAFNTDGIYSKRIGELVKVKPCGEEYKGETFVGILLGELIVSPHISHDSKTGTLTVGAMTNPAIFVPKLKKIIYGYESWWTTITNKDDLSDLNISDETIENTWYIQLLKSVIDMD